MMRFRPDRAVIFDLDGVLIHSPGAHRDAFEEALKAFGVNDFEYGQYAGWKTRDVVVDVLERRGLKATREQIDSVSARKSELARQMLESTQPVDPAAGPLLARLAAVCPLALASSGSRLSVERFLQWTGSRSLFRSVLTSEDIVRAKPDPEIYARTSANLGVGAEHCVVIEDAVAGVTAARAAGAEAIGVAGTVSGQQLRDAGAAQVVGSLGDLVGMVPEPSVERAQWTAVIPAAGRGSRLGFHRPKILYPVAGRMILEWMLDFLEPQHEHLVFVLSPDGAAEVTGELDKLIPGRFEVVIQEQPTGMGDAVERGLSRVRTPHLSIVWGDQVTLQRDSVAACQRLHQGPLEPHLTVPTVLRDQPYIHFERDASGRICGLRQAREGDAMPPRGESDTGFFCCNAEALRRLLPKVRATAGSATGEFNFLPVIPLAATMATVVTPRVMRLEETMGINSAADAEQVAEFLRRTHEYQH